ncbi:MAG TPA: monovalent cation/H(+) antiporter subunit G [Microthrixaceae bacterium]|nr:monovalent cation/H(+) antiporter subunit G [Microthrixaceae bacterium]HNI34005.1 monovalent cation/H(+) antiporter subunit G [Microthrixaceae bacterium]
MLGELLVLVGAILILLSSLGILRFDDVFAQMHFLAKASTLGVVLVLVGAATAMVDPNDWSSLLLAAFLQMLTSPVAGNLIARSTYLTSSPQSAEAGIVADARDPGNSRGR